MPAIGLRAVVKCAAANGMDVPYAGVFAIRWPTRASINERDNVFAGAKSHGEFADGDN
jgi:hypothetical protein